MSAPRESNIQARIRLAIGRIPGVRVWRQNVGRHKNAKGRWVSYNIKGMADLSGILADGRRIELEVKRPGEEQSKAQVAWQRMIEKYRGVYAVVTSVEDAVTVVRDALGGGGPGGPRNAGES